MLLGRREPFAEGTGWLSMSDVQAYIGDGLQRFTDEIFEFLQIPSVSAKSDHDANTRRVATREAGRRWTRGRGHRYARSSDRLG